MEIKNIKQYLQKNKTLRAVLLIAAGLLAGWLIFGGSSPAPHGNSNADSAAAHQSEVWTCSMHPQIRTDRPGDCPLCGMDLIPLNPANSASGAPVPPDAIQMSEEATALANIQTSVVSQKDPVKEIMLYGVIAPDERSLQSQTAHIGGRIEKLLVDFTGVAVHTGQPLVTIYSPELLTAQQELLEALKLRDTQPLLLQAAREKLRLWKLTPRQIERIESSGAVSPVIDIRSTTSGIVVNRKVSEGDYVTPGTVLFDVADLSTVWAMFDAYEMDLAFLGTGDPIRFTVQAVPGQTFSGKISFIDPILDPTTRTARVRVEIANPGLLLKPGMYANATVRARLRRYGDQIVIPQSAVLWTGPRSIVYVSLPGYDTPVYRIREIELGPSLGNSYVVLSGLKDGEVIVTNGAFAIDASAQLEGKPSMMNSHPGKPAAGHAHHGMAHTSGNGGAQTAAPRTHHTGAATGGTQTATPHTHHNAGDATGGTQTATSHTRHNVATTNGGTRHATLTVQGSCAMCKQRIEKAALSVEGVTSAVWDINQKTLHLNFDPAKTDLRSISKAIAGAGHDTGQDKAPREVYDSLPACCKYRK